MQGEGDMETAEPAGTRGLRIPDSLRCRRSDGRKWRCYQPVMPGLRSCEHHRMRCHRDYNQATKLKITKLPVKSSPWRRMEGEQIEEGLISMDQNEKPQATVKLPPTGLSFCDSDLLRCNEDNNKIKSPEPMTSARSEVVREESSSHPPGFPADSSFVSTVEAATSEGVMETLRRSQEQVETMRRLQEQDRLQVVKLLKDNNMLWDKVHYLEKSNKHYKEKIFLLSSELTALKQQSSPPPPLLPTAPLVRADQHEWQEDGASSRDPRMDKEIRWIHSMIAHINSHMAHSSIILSQVADVVAHLGRDCEN
ncbi:Growth-regulating factor 12 [Platanthera zijinensis]|uniref:Growth-regulating factor 12 n=1 Tax=Platanthera zijinensis TaxID=2320716 RepID=A0AAP0BXR0_9ASPA